MDKWKNKIRFYLDSNESKTGRIVDLILTMINIFSCILIVIEAYSGSHWSLWLSIAEYSVITIFSVEYALRLI